jgi:hypothetical protein
MMQSTTPPPADSLTNLEARGLLLGFNTWGTPHTGFGHRAQLGRATEPCLSAPSPKLDTYGWPWEATLHPLDSVGGLGMPARPQKAGLVNIMAWQVTEGILIHG